MIMEKRQLKRGKIYTVMAYKQSITKNKTKILKKLIHFAENWGHIRIAGFIYYSF